MPPNGTRGCPPPHPAVGRPPVPVVPCAGPGCEPVVFVGRTDGRIVPARGPPDFGCVAVHALELRPPVLLLVLPTTSRSTAVESSGASLVSVHTACMVLWLAATIMHAAPPSCILRLGKAERRPGAVLAACCHPDAAASTPLPCHPAFQSPSWDPIFEPDGFDRTYAELDKEVSGSGQGGARHLRREFGCVCGLAGLRAQQAFRGSGAEQSLGPWRQMSLTRPTRVLARHLCRWRSCLQ